MECQRPPKGWWCSIEAGHDGPCAARLVNSHIERIDRAWADGHLRGMAIGCALGLIAGQLLRHS